MSTTANLTKKLEARYGLKGMTKTQVCEEFGISHNNKCFATMEHTRHGRGRAYRYDCETVAKWWNSTRVPGYASNIL